MQAYQKIIILDVKRTGAKDIGDKERDAMTRVLYAFAKRNMEIGYCQGMNFVCHFLLEMEFSEEETFWLICYVFEQLMPRNYYVNMIPAIADIEIFKILLRESRPKFHEHLSSLGVDLNFMLIPCFVTIFTNLKNFYVV